MGDNIIMPIAISTEDTTRSMTRKGINSMPADLEGGLQLAEHERGQQDREGVVLRLRHRILRGEVGDLGEGAFVGLCEHEMRDRSFGGRAGLVSGRSCSDRRADRPGSRSARPPGASPAG